MLTPSMASDGFSAGMTCSIIWVSLLAVSALNASDILCG